MELYPILSQGVLLSAIFITVLRIRKLASICLISVFILLLLPINQISIWQYLRAVFGDFSISLSLIAVWLLYLRVLARDGLEKKFNNNINWRPINWIFIPLGLFLYPLALGLTIFDPYMLGYNHISLMVLSVLLAVTLLIKQHIILAIIIASSLLAYSLDILESTNFWDYLIDPLLFLYLMIRLGFQWLRISTLKIKRRLIS